MIRALGTDGIASMRGAPAAQQHSVLGGRTKPFLSRRTMPGDSYALWRNLSCWDRDGSDRCAEDRRLFVEKLNGGRWTLNMTHARPQITIRLCLVFFFGLGVALGY